MVPVRNASAILLALALLGSAPPARADNAPAQATPPSASTDTQPAASSSSKGSDDKSAAQSGADDSAAKAADKPDNGVKFSLQEQSEVWGNLTGGGKAGTSYNGLTTATLDIDLEKALDWRKARFFVSAFDIHGHGPSRSLVGNNQLVSNIEASPSLKLYDLWFEQRLFGNLYVRVGQEGANDEMMTTAFGSLFLNSSFGFPGLSADNLPSGGPNYPMATPFARARWKATNNLTLVGAVYNGDPAPPGAGDPQLRDRNGTAFRTDGNTLAFAEIRVLPEPEASDSLMTVYKIGAWHHSGSFADQRFDNAGGLLASPLTTGAARMHSGNFAIYGIIDQVLWHREGTQDQGIAAFLQVQGGPSDRNLSNVFVEGGFNWNAPFPDRGSDVAGIAVAYLGTSPAARRYSRDLVAFGQINSAYASNETIVEASYKAPVNDWFTVQPDAQLVIHPNAGIPNNFSRSPLATAFVVGVRATVKLQEP